MPCLGVVRIRECRPLKLEFDEPTGGIVRQVILASGRCRGKMYCAIRACRSKPSAFRRIAGSAETRRWECPSALRCATACNQTRFLPNDPFFRPPQAEGCALKVQHPAAPLSLQLTTEYTVQTAELCGNVRSPPGDRIRVWAAISSPATANRRPPTDRSDESCPGP